jgi:hypothetical protein
MSINRRMLAERNIAATFSLQPSLPSVSGTELDEHPSGFSGLHQDEPGFAANARLPGIGALMRSDLVYLAGLKIENRFLLSATVMRAVRVLHVNSGRTEDTLNRVFTDVAQGRYVDVKLPEIAPPPVIDALVVTPIV